MSKAIEGAAILGGTLAAATAVAIFNPALFFTSPLLDKALIGAALMGAGMEAGAIGQALSTNRGMNITTRQPASFRQIVYGTQRVGGVEVYRSTTGSHKDQFNYVIVLAGHEIAGITALYLDGRRVYFVDNPAAGTTTSSAGVTFGGAADSNTYTGPNGATYNFGGAVYCEAYYGTQTDQPNTIAGGGFSTGLQANDPTWSPTSNGTPYLGGCAYVYLKVEYNTTLFPGEPEIRFDVLGKPVYDPRSGTTAYSSNWALIVNDVITDPVYGLGDSSVNQEQLIAAANVADELVPLASGLSEARYGCHYHYDTSQAPGDVLNTMMTAAAGRLSRIGGEWYLWPAYFQGPTATFDANSLTAAMQWTPTRSFHELTNRVNGTYVAPAYPYNTAGNLYDANGWYDDTIANTFNLAFQPTNYPQYACDTLHGYPSDEYLTQDGGVALPLELGLQCVLSLAQAQRLAKIALLRNRQQGTGTFQMSLAAFQLQPCDTFTVSFPPNGWVDKQLEVNSVQFQLQSNGGSAPQVVLSVGVNETNAEVYEWSTAEELTIYDVPALSTQAPYTPAPPTNMVVTSSSATALVGADGIVTPRLQVSWDTPLDIRVTGIQLQYQLVGSGAWLDGGTADVSLNAAFIGPVVAGQQYNVRIRSVRAAGTTSAWVEVDGSTAGLVLSLTTTSGIGIGSIVGEAYTDGTAGIECNPFTATLGNASVSYFPSGSVPLYGLTQQTLYYVYVVDPNITGGNLTPIATTNQSDYLGKLGYFLIDSTVTPYAAKAGSSTSGSLYYPTTSNDFGTRTTLTPDAAFDGDLSTFASVSGSYIQRPTTTPTQPDEPPSSDGISAQVESSPTDTPTYTTGDCTWSGWPTMTLTAASTLTVVAAATVFTGGELTITALVGSTTTIMADLTATTAQTTYTLPVAAGVDLSTITVECSASADSPTGTSATCSLRVYEIYVQS